MNYPYHLNFNRSILEFVSIILLILFIGYPLISLLRPEENYINILKKPLRLLGFNILVILSASLILWFSSSGLHLKILSLVLSLITMFLTVMAYMRRISYFNSGYDKNLEKTTEKHIKKPLNPNVVIGVDEKL